MEITRGKILSLVVATIYLIATVWKYGFDRELLRTCVFLFFPLALIWFAEAIGSSSNLSNGRYGLRMRPNPDEQIPSFFISLMGWVFLVVVPLVLYFMRIIWQ